jgi:hypothetical protein
VLIAAAKFVAAVVTSSSAMLTEGIHSLIEAGDGGLLLLGAHLGAKPADAEYPFGHGRVESAHSEGSCKTLEGSSNGSTTLRRYLWCCVKHETTSKRPRTDEIAEPSRVP